jgi:AcrR family transcriptional regulator
MEAASLYYHFKSKQEILFAILDRTLDDLLAGVGRAVASADGPEARLRAAVRFHVLFHTDSQHEAFLSHSELRSLTQANLRLVLARRDEYERVFRGLLASGARAGVFQVSDVRLTAMAILTMCTGVATWFSDGGRLAPEAIADRYVEMIMRSVKR